MTNFLWGFVIGATVVDFLWAWKMGIAQLFWSRVTRVFNRIFRR